VARKKSSLLWLGLGAALIAAIACAFYINARIVPLLSRDLRARATTRIYAAPLRLRAGDRLSLGELKSRLTRAGYKEGITLPMAAGHFRLLDSTVEVFLRSFEHPFINATPVLVAINIAQGRVNSLRMLEGAPLLEIAVEPELLYELSGPDRVRREPLKLEEIPPDLTRALVAIEDRRFYEHRGVDPKGIARALVRNLKKKRFAEGGSTLTQQLARRVYLSPRKTLVRKFREALLALYLETRYSKDEIIRLYLENVYFGQKGTVSVVGLPAAARYFFAKSPADLTLPESALLAGLLRSPNRLNPFFHPKDAKKRRAVVLNAMWDMGSITEQQALQAKEQPIDVTRSAHIKPRDADYFLAYVLRRLEAKYEDQELVTRGLSIHTTLDPWLQAAASRAVGKAKHQAALIAMDPQTGAIRALVGGKNFRTSPFNRATRALRQPGSAFKPFLYGAALRPRIADRQWTPSTLLADATQTFRIPGGKWSPRNYDRRYRGKVDLRRAFASSLNAAAVNLAAKVGPSQVIEYAQSLGIRSPLRHELGLALGTSEVTLEEITGAYSAFANGGSRVEPYGIEVTLDAEGTVIEYHHPTPERVLSTGEAYLMTHLLREVVKTGTAKSLAHWGLAEIAAGKTGTSNGGKDAWFIGFTPTLTAGVWTGADRPKALGLTGAGAALPLWADFMRQATGPLTANEQALWPRPSDIVLAKIDPASGQLARAGCPVKVREMFLSGTVPHTACQLHSGGLRGWFKNMFSRPKLKGTFR
jgi:penicillin-binding protein 1B